VDIAVTTVAVWFLLTGPFTFGTYLSDRDRLLAQLEPKDQTRDASYKATDQYGWHAADVLPLGITPHKLRHTFASILVAIGKDPTYVMQQLGDTDPAFTPRVYAHAMRRSEEEREQLKALIEGDDWAQIGHKTAESTSAAVEDDTD
jgi:integrase